MSTKHRDELAQRVLRLTDMALAQSDPASEGLRSLRVYAELADLEAEADRRHDPPAASSLLDTLGRGGGVVLST